MSRLGPDLANAGLRIPDANWHHLHFFAPRATAGWSLMPAYRHLYEVRPIQGQPTEESLKGLPATFAPPIGMEVIPTPEAKALVAFLLSRNQSCFQPASESPEEQGSPDVRAPGFAGQSLFQKNCAVCHQANGLGIPRLYPPLAGSEWVVTGSSWQGDNHLALVILGGLQGPVTVKGQIFNASMPPWNILGDEEIASVLTHIRSEWGNAAPPITPEFVRALREETRTRRAPWTQAELEALPTRPQP